jgi:hypothetical protein
MRFFPCFTLSFACCVLVSCGGIAKTSREPAVEEIPMEGGTHRYRGRVVSGGIMITEKGAPLTSIRTALPVVEEWRFVNGGKNVVTKSRAEHGPATIELFETESGELKGSVAAYAVKDGHPAWAAGYAE